LNRDELELLAEELAENGELLLLAAEKAEDEDALDEVDEVDEADEEAEWELGSILGEGRPLVVGGRKSEGEKREAAAAWKTAAAAAWCW